MKKLSTLLAVVALIGFILIIVAVIFNAQFLGLIAALIAVSGITSNVVVNSFKTLKS